MRLPRQRRGGIRARLPSPTAWDRAPLLMLVAGLLLMTLALVEAARAAAPLPIRGGVAALSAIRVTG